MGWAVGTPKADCGAFPPPENADLPNTELVFAAFEVEANAEVPPPANAANPPPPELEVAGVEPNAVAGLMSDDWGCDGCPKEDCPNTDVGVVA